MPSQSYWEKALYQTSYDLIIVGAGLTGQSTAYFFKKENPDAKVLVLDRGFFPIGASTRNAGFACIGTVGEHLADLKIDSEKSLKKRITSRFEGLQLLRETLGDEAIEFEETGGWEIYTDSNEFQKSKKEIDRFNLWMEEITGEKNWYEAGTYLGVPSIYNRLEGMLHPGKMIKKLYELNIATGVEFRLNTSIKEVFIEKREVITEQGIKINGARIVLATNAFTTKLLPKRTIKPGRGYVFVTNEIDTLQWKGTFHYNKGYVYFRNLGDRRMLIGGGRNVDIDSETTTDFGVNEAIKSYLIEFTNEILKLPNYWEIEQEWSGIMGFTESKSPMVEHISEGCLLVAGLSGMGVALGMKLGKEAAENLAL